VGYIALKIRLSGLVQGVGFRPFIHRIALRTNVQGYCLNLGGSEVEIHVEGSSNNVSKFMKFLLAEKPPPAIIDYVEVFEDKIEGYKSFTIKKSGVIRKLLSQIPPDFAVCNECLKEVLNPNDRRYKYPFNSCAWCGPRFSIIEKPPYDRENTSMRDFPLCSECLKEYTDIDNIRRYHAQGISCPKCGPKVWLTDKHGNPINVEDPIHEASKLIDDGFIVAVKGIGGFHIAALASSDDVVLELRKRKNRPQKPFALMALNEEVALKLVELDNEGLRIIRSISAPIVLAPMREDANVSRYVAPGLKKLGVMLAYSPLHYLLLKDTKDKYLIMTSGNPPGQPMCTTNECALSKLKEYVDYFLLHNRRIINRVDDSVVRITRGRITFIRRSRGYAPLWIKTSISTNRPIIAFGAMLQNAGGIGIDKYIIPTQYIGDCENRETLEFLEQALSFLIKSYDIDLRKAIVVSDMHPEYPTTKLAREYSERYGVEHLMVQHHHAHIASVMAELDLPIDEEVVGIAIDGVGYGDDGAIWGGEVLVASYDTYKRVGHLEYHVLPGGDRSTIYPARYLLSILYSKLGYEETLGTAKRLGIIDLVPGKDLEVKITLKQVDKGMPLTSSTGRFLDAISTLLKISWHRTYEGEPAIKLEEYSRPGNLEIQYPVENRDNVDIIRISDVVLGVIELLEDGVDKHVVAYAVQYWLGYTLGKIALKHVNRKRRIIVVSGGAAVNEYIMKGIEDSVKGTSALLFSNEKVPRGDGGISTGQIAIAKAKIIKELS